MPNHRSQWIRRQVERWSEEEPALAVAMAFSAVENVLLQIGERLGLADDYRPLEIADELERRGQIPAAGRKLLYKLHAVRNMVAHGGDHLTVVDLHEYLEMVATSIGNLEPLLAEDAAA